MIFTKQNNLTTETASKERERHNYLHYRYTPFIGYRLLANTLIIGYRYTQKLVLFLRQIFLQNIA